MRYPHVMEFKFNTPHNKNATTADCLEQLARLINEAQTNDDVKVILLHGGKFFSSGNDLKHLASFSDKTREYQTKEASKGIFDKIGVYLYAIHKCTKPLVAVVRGGCHGISFTSLSLFDFVYCAPDAKFQAPFMQSFQSPEGSSTYTFP